MTRATTLLLGAALLAALSAATPATADDSDKAKDEKYLLRYQFEPGETVRWRVVHLAKVKTTVGGTTQTAETVSKSIKAWKVTDVTDNGSATFEHKVEQVDMRSKVTGRQEVTYNSNSDEEAPPGFETVAESVGKLLSLITLNDRGEVIGRKNEHSATTNPNEGQVTMTLPEEPSCRRRNLVVSLSDGDSREQRHGRKDQDATEILARASQERRGHHPHGHGHSHTRSRPGHRGTTHSTANGWDDPLRYRRGPSPQPADGS